MRVRTNVCREISWKCPENQESLASQAGQIRLTIQVNHERSFFFFFSFLACLLPAESELYNPADGSRSVLISAYMDAVKHSEQICMISEGFILKLPSTNYCIFPRVACLKVTT